MSAATLTGSVTTDQASALTGVTRRRIDNWIRVSSFDATVPAAGPASARQFSFRDVVRVAVLGELVDTLSTRPGARFCLEELVGLAAADEPILIEVGHVVLTVDVDTIAAQIAAAWPNGETS